MIECSKVSFIHKDFISSSIYASLKAVSYFFGRTSVEKVLVKFLNCLV